MAKPAYVHLASFGLTLAGLTRLGTREVRAIVTLSGKSARALAPLRPPDRRRALRQALATQFARLQRALPDATLRPLNRRHEGSLEATLPARRVAALAAVSGVEHVSVHAIAGRKPKAPKQSPGWFCVWGVVALQIQGRTRGLITLEDRYVVVRARDERDAERRLRREWRRYATPYLTTGGRLVRWQLLEVRDVSNLFADDIDPRGTEVYSRLRDVRMKPEYVWKIQGRARSARPARRYNAPA